MARHCEICGKGHAMGNAITTRGKAKYLGGVGTKVTGIARRKFKPNLQRLKVTIGRGTNTTKLVCTQCIRSGMVAKVVRHAPFKLSKADQPKATPPKANTPKANTPKANTPKATLPKGTPPKANTPKAGAKA